MVKIDRSVTHRPKDATRVTGGDRLQDSPDVYPLGRNPKGWSELPNYGYSLCGRRGTQQHSNICRLYPTPQWNPQDRGFYPAWASLRIPDYRMSSFRRPLATAVAGVMAMLLTIIARRLRELRYSKHIE